MATSMDLIKPLVTLVAIVNPLGIVPFFIHYTQGYTHAQRMRTAKVSAISAFFVISISALIGQQLLGFFGISIASFQVGGGLLLLISSLSMLNAQPAEAKASAEEVRATEVKAMVIYATQTRQWWELAILVGYGIVVAIITLLAFRLAEPIARVLGKTGINVMTRLMGLILAALAVEVMANGLGKLFPILERTA
ncbi:MAG: hypothetical protein DI563_27270 [Variovorax paradoxus]|uniref:UPF0056 membrane protein n=1 Tax=Variovorax paradoxus TaxID=34073 RepID=A0A2W5RL00_VARPD|nr:MAG: hypothetical protein DI563_27270 [Variovorax paradoxus]